MRLTKFLSSRLEALGFKLVSQPTLNIVAFKGSNSKLLSEKLWQRGWFVSYIPRLDCIRIVVMPHLRKRHLMAFLKDLSEIARANATTSQS
jgi:tyrosine decarboxylase/aspartate 1-decarboxylase